jgi:hypothetical protein
MALVDAGERLSRRGLRNAFGGHGKAAIKITIDFMRAALPSKYCLLATIEQYK